MYLGATPVATSYLGSQQVYPNASLALSADLLAFAAAGGSQELTVAVEEGQMWALSVPVGWSASSQSGTGTATLTLTIDNNTTTVARSGALTVVSEDLTATCALAQAAGAKSYGEISIGAYGYGVLPAGGGTVSPTLAYSQPWTWNGVNGYFRGHGRLFRFRGRCCHRNGVCVHERYDGVGPDDRCDSYGFGVA